MTTQMPIRKNVPWEKKVVSPHTVISIIKPGMTIFLGTGVSEPRTLHEGKKKATLRQAQGRPEDELPGRLAAP